MNKKYIKSLLYPIALVFSLIIAGCADELFDESNGQQGKAASNSQAILTNSRLPASMTTASVMATIWASIS